jgi:coproporphyrinogen III oxidase
MSDLMTARKAEAAAWFRTLRDRIVASFEALETAQAAGRAPARFEVTPTARADGGGGLMSVLRGGAVFEKVGVNVSEVHGTLHERAQKAMAARGVPGMADDPRFWASGISLVAHMANPHCPAVHLNTRMFWTPHAWWFGGGSDLNPALEYAEDTAQFHRILQAACDAHDPGYYPRFRAWASSPIADVPGVSAASSSTT